MLKELSGQLLAYLTGAADLERLALWLASADWSEGTGLRPAEREAWGRFELLVTEVNEGLRDEAELVVEAWDWILNSGTLASWIGRLPVTASTSASDLVAARIEQERAVSAWWSPVLQVTGGPEEEAAQTPAGRSLPVAFS